MSDIKLPPHLTVDLRDKYGIGIKVFLDGVEMSDVMEANTEEGWVIHYESIDDAFLDLEEETTKRRVRKSGVVTAEIVPNG